MDGLAGVSLSRLHCGSIRPGWLGSFHSAKTLTSGNGLAGWAAGEPEPDDIPSNCPSSCASAF